ncbi:cation diffusion facilitator family transporter [soil metagenome]
MFQNIKVRIQLMAVVIGLVLMAVKFLAFFLTSSNAILTDALESIVNVIAGGFALYSLWLAAHPRDENHPYGHGKVEFISAGVEGSLIAIAGLIIFGKSIYNIIHPQAIEQLDWGLALTAGAGAVNFGLGWFLVREGKKHRSMTLQADGKHLMSDGWSSLGIVIGLILMILIPGNAWIDNAVAIIFGGYIIYAGVKLIRGSVAGIMDEADIDLIKQVVDILNKNRRPNWIDIHNLRIIKYGANLHVDAHVTLPSYLSFQEVHDEMEAIDKVISDHFGEETEFFLHPDPCMPNACSVFTTDKCSEHQLPLEQREAWTLEKVMRNKKHGKGG